MSGCPNEKVSAGPIEARTLRFDLHWRCAHESATVVLGAAREAANRRLLARLN